jgi:hypothetical protein
MLLAPGWAAAPLAGAVAAAAAATGAASLAAAAAAASLPRAPTAARPQRQARRSLHAVPPAPPLLACDETYIDAATLSAVDPPPRSAEARVAGGRGPLTAVFLHGLLGSGKNWRSFSKGVRAVHHLRGPCMRGQADPRCRWLPRAGVRRTACSMHPSPWCALVAMLCIPTPLLQVLRSRRRGRHSGEAGQRAVQEALGR